MKRVLILAGASASGKTTVSNEILEQSDKFTTIRSATTRAPRGDGFDCEYVYVTREEFCRGIESGEMLEYTEYGGELYGTQHSELQRAEREGKLPLLVLDFAGVKGLKASEYKDGCFAVYIYDELNTLEERLYARYMTPPTVEGLAKFVKRREQNIADYLTFEERSELFDLILPNADAKETAEKIIAGMQSDAVTEDRGEIISKLYNMAHSKMPKQ